MVVANGISGAANVPPSGDLDRRAAGTRALFGYDAFDLGD